MNVLAKLGEEIKKIRLLLNLEQKDFAKIIGISNVHLSNLEKGKKLPSKELLIRAYKEINNEVPEHVLELFSEAKSDKKSENFSNNIIYELQESGTYTIPKLKELLKNEPDNPLYIFGLLNLYKENGKTKEARQHLLESLVSIQDNETKRWVEATYFLLENNFKMAIDLMIKAIDEFSISKNKEDYSKRKAGLLFELASMYFEYGYYSYNSVYDINLAIDCFKNALDTFKNQREIYNEPKYEMYYANVFWWLAFLGIDSENNWQEYINKAENVILINHEIKINNSTTSKNAKGLYSQEYIYQLISGMAEAYSQIAKINFESKKIDKEKILGLLKKGEFLLAQHSPVDLISEKREFYNFYFSYSCFYSIKAEILNNLSMDYEKYLNLCEKGLEFAVYSDNKNNSKQFLQDINHSENKELKFYISKRFKDFEYIRQKVKNDE
jgi:transcriptional regulator with XRE-family HTH domain